MKEVSSLAAGAMSSRSTARAEARSPMYERWRLPALKFITMFGKPLHGKSREQAIAEAVVNRFGCERWCDALEREISLRH
jgi:hypothetical protein